MLNHGSARYNTLLVRPWTAADAVGLREAIDEDVDHVRPWLSWALEEPASLERTRARLLGYEDQFRRGEAFRYAITRRDLPSLILGGAHVNCRVGPAARDIGYWVRKSAVRQGIAAAATAALAVDVFGRPDVDRLIIHCDVANEASAALARALGFEDMGTRTIAYPNGAPRPIREFELTRTRYRAEHAPMFRDRARRVRLVTGTAAAQR